MAKITAPVEGYTGTSAGVEFKDGVGYSENPNALAWLWLKGYKVTEDGQEAAPEVTQAPAAPAEEPEAPEAPAEKLPEDEQAEADLFANQFADLTKTVSKIEAAPRNHHKPAGADQKKGR